MFERDGVRIWQPPRWLPPKHHDGGYAPLDLLARMAAARSIYPDEFDVIHAFDHRPNVSFPWYLWLQQRGKNKTPLMAADWCDWWTQGGITTSRRSSPGVDAWEAKLEEGSKTSADAVTVISSVLENRALDIGIPASQVKCIPSGCDGEGIRCEDKKSCKRKLDWPEKDPLLCFVGLALWDLDIIADTVLEVRKSHPRTGLLLIGGGVEAEAIRSMSGKLQNELLVLPGQVPYSELSRYLGAADIHLLPLEDNLANQARIPNKLGDYLASGRPVITQNIGDTGDVVEQTSVGLVAGRTCKTMAEAVSYLLENPSLQSEMGQHARHMAETERSWSTMAVKLLEFYNRML